MVKTKCPLISAKNCATSSKKHTPATVVSVFGQPRRRSRCGASSKPPESTYQHRRSRRIAEILDGDRQLKRPLGPIYGDTPRPPEAVSNPIRSSTSLEASAHGSLQQTDRRSAPDKRHRLDQFLPTDLHQGLRDDPSTRSLRANPGAEALHGGRRYSHRSHSSNRFRSKRTFTCVTTPMAINAGRSSPKNSPSTSLQSPTSTANPAPLSSTFTTTNRADASR